MSRSCAAWLFFVLLGVGTASARADALLQEDFSGATPGANSSLAGTQFHVTSGAVDILGVLNGTFAGCGNNPTGNCIDLVGSPGNGAIASVPKFNLIAGDTYKISFGYILQGFATGTTPTSDFTVGLGSFSDMLTAIPMVQTGSISFKASSNQSAVALTFATDTAPDAFHGAVLDHIVLTQTSGSAAVPEPDSAVLLAIGAGLYALVGLRKLLRAR